MDFQPGNRPIVSHLVKLQHLLTSYVCLCSEQTILPHIRVTIIGKRREEDTSEVTKEKFTSVIFSFTWMSRSGTIMANVRREVVLNYPS